MLVDWGFVVLLIGVLLSMAMVGAAYLVRDERKENLVWNGVNQVIDPSWVAVLV